MEEMYSGCGMKKGRVSYLGESHLQGGKARKQPSNGLPPSAHLHDSVLAGRARGARLAILAADLALWLCRRLLIARFLLSSLLLGAAGRLQQGCWVLPRQGLAKCPARQCCSLKPSVSNWL